MFRLAGMTASVAARYTKTRIKSALDKEQESEHYASMYSDIGDELVATLGELKGAAMKVGQAISQMKHILPEEFTEKLSKLQNQAPPMGYAVIQRQIQSELGFPPEKLFRYFDSNPFASASIGQVHRATCWDGREVVVKVQYPGVDASVESDMAHLRRLLKLGGLLQVDKEALEAVFDEIYHSIVNELDYRKEAENVRRFSEFHKDDCGIIIPEVIEDFTSHRVLTLEYCEGDGIEEVAASTRAFVATDSENPGQATGLTEPQSDGYTPEVVNLIGQRIYHMVSRQIYQLQSIHSDPHPGNFAFTPAGEIIVYDFGCISDLSDSVVAQYRDAVHASLDGDYQKLDTALLNLGVRSPGHPALNDDFYQTCLAIILPALAGETAYDFSSSKLHEKVMQNKQLVLDNWQAFQPSADTVFVNRVLAGQYFNMAQLGVNASFKSLLYQSVDYRE
jgi:predicted unusual protein kinase regulating ubiquinone biosynthesis (AarF/ABC1/UbiB family)